MANSKSSKRDKRDKRDKRRKTKKGGNADCKGASAFGEKLYGTDQHRVSETDNTIRMNIVGGNDTPVNAEVALKANDNSLPSHSMSALPPSQQYVGGAPLYTLTPLSLNNASDAPLNAYTGGNGVVLPSFIKGGAAVPAMLMIPSKRSNGKKTKKNKQRRSKK
jgi:hypothetical protein